MKKFILVAVLSILSFTGRAEELVAGWQLTGIALSPEDNLTEVDPEACVAWFELRGDNLYFRTSFSDVSSLRLKEFQYLDERDNYRMYIADFADQEGSLCVVVPSSGVGPSSISFVNSPMNLIMEGTAIEENTQDCLLFLTMSFDPKFNNGLPLESVYPIIKDTFYEMFSSEE